MSGSASIKAGAAFVELFTDATKLDRGLNSAAAKCKAWGGKVRNIGAAIFTAGSAALGGIGAIAAQAADIGGMFNDLSRKSGASVESLSLLKFAADQCGSSIEGVAGGIKFLQKNLAAAKGGSTETIETFDKLGVSVDELSKLSPDEQFLRMADAVAQVKDPAERTALAMKVFGKSGADLIPLLSQGSAAIRSFMKEGELLGLKLSTEEAQALDDFADGFDKVKNQVIRAGIAIAGQLAPILTEFSTKISRILTDVIDWITKNSEMIVSIAKMVVEVTAAGAAMIVMGQAISTAGTIIKAFNTTLQFSVAHAKGLGAALAVAGVTLFAQQIYAADAGVRSLVSQLDILQGINGRLAKQQMREQRKTMEAAGGLEGDKKKEFLNEELGNAQTNLEGYGKRIQEQQALIKKHGDDDEVNSRTGNKIVDVAREELKQLERRRDLAEDHVHALQDALDAEKKTKPNPKPGGDSGGKDNKGADVFQRMGRMPGMPIGSDASAGPERPLTKKENEDFQRKMAGEQGFDVGGAAGRENPLSPIDKVFQGQRDNGRYELMQAEEARDKAIAEAARIRALEAKGVPGHAKLPGFQPREMEGMGSASQGGFSSQRITQSYSVANGPLVQILDEAKRNYIIQQKQLTALDTIKGKNGRAWSA